MNNTQRMGRGLEALWGGTEPLAEQKESSPCTLKLNTIIPNANQPRKYFDLAGLEELAASIKEQGIIQPLLVRPSTNEGFYDLVAGERRFRAAKIAGLEEVPVYVRKLDDIEIMAAALIENIQRENLSPIEEANALHSLREQCGITQEELATRLGKSRSAITNALRLLQLSKDAQSSLQKGEISAGHARALLSLAPNEQAQEELRLYIISNVLSVRDAEAMVQTYKEQSIFPWQVQNDNINAEIEMKPVNNTSRRIKSEYIQNIQKRIKNNINLKTSISGSEERGRVTLTYTNTQELEQILKIMGVNEAE